MKLLRPTPVAWATLLALHLPAAFAQADEPGAPPAAATLPAVTVRASADASAQGLAPAYPGGQVARGGRAGILGTRNNMETPFSITSYTNELIQDRQAKSVGEVLQDDPSVRVARGFGNFQESYFIRGFILSSDDVAYNGLYSLLPRQYIATELFERVEVLRGASAFLNGANPGGGGIGGAINLLPKRAPNEPLTRVTAGVGSGGQASLAADIARRFGPDGATGIRVNAAARGGGTAIDDEQADLGLVAVGLDWRSRDVRLSGDIGWQDNRLARTRPSVTLGPLVTQVPRAPDGKSNFAQSWTYSDERDLFGTLRGEWDLTPSLTAWAAYGGRRSEEANSLANLTVTDGGTGAGKVYRFDNTREDRVDTGELGLRGKLRTGSVGHEWVVAGSWFELERDNAYAMDFFNTFPTSLYHPVSHPKPTGSPAFIGNELANPALTGRTRLASLAIGDTLSMADGRLLLTLGVRHQKLHLTDYAYNTGAVAGDYDRSRTSPVAGAVFRLTPQWSVYANRIEGLSQGESIGPQAANGTAPARPAQTLPPYVSRQTEVGVKFDGGRMGGGLAVFSTTRPRAYLDPGTNVFAAVGEDRHRGVELTAFGEATRGLRVLAGATWLDARQRSTGNPASDGRRVIGIPRFQANLGVEWDLPAVRGLALDARVVHTGASHADAANQLKVPGWTRLDVGLRYLTEFRGHMVTWRARVDNLADRSYWASAGGFPNKGYLAAGAPRTFGLSAQVDF